MTAQSVGVFTIEFPDPYTLNYYNDKFVTLGSNISFQYPITNNIQTLSTKNADSGNDPYGILYVPDLESDGCKSSEAQYVPSNATRASDLPQGTDYALIGVFPWFSPTCVLEYMKSARSSPVKALLVYQPGASDEMPPLPNDPSWSIGDGGGWKSSNDFPAYALASVSGSIVMTEMSLYSGNLTDAPHGSMLASLFSPTDYVRLWATVSTAGGSQLPSLWVFLVIVLGLLILIIFLTSVFMHVVQRRRRLDLQRRVISGEVDLEALGVKRLTVPREYLEKLPLYTYSGPSVPVDHEKSPPPVQEQTENMPSPIIEAETGLKSSPMDTPAAVQEVTTQPAGPTTNFSQPTCPICLDDFEPNETQVRELPCGHIFHPDCVDTFLHSNSSLCPMCKATVLPTGYCPARITNVMVRRERMIRRMRTRNPTDGTTTIVRQQDWRTLPLRLTGGPGSLAGRIGDAIRGRRRLGEAQTRPLDIEMAASRSDVATTPADMSGPNPSMPPMQAAQGDTWTENMETSTPARQALAQERAHALIADSQIPAADEDEEQTQPRWRRGLRKVFPGFA